MNIETILDEESGRVVVIDTLPENEPQAYTVCVKDENDWEEIHNYIINENEIDGIPNRRIDCITDLPFSTKRSVYSMSVEEARILESNSKVEWVEKSSMHNPLVLEQRKIDEEFDRHTDTNRFKKNITFIRQAQSISNTTNYNQWGLYRHQSKTNNISTQVFYEVGDAQYSLTGKNVDVVIMDTGVRWDHPEFLLPGYTSVPVGVSTITVSRVRDILLHGPSAFGFTWAANGLTAPGTGSLTNYTEATTLRSSSFNGSWHGSHVAGTAAGNQFGLAYEANIWSIACIDRSDVGFSDPSDGFDYIRIWHSNKPINPETGVRNPTVVNCSWGHRQFVRKDLDYNVTFRGNSYNRTYVADNNANLPAVSLMTTNGSLYFEFTTRRVSGQTQVDELLDDPNCKNIVLVCAAGNSGYGNGKQDLPDGPDYNNRFTSGTYYYSSFAYDVYYCRNGTPAIGHIGLPDAIIKVGAMDWYTSYINSTFYERKAPYSNNGPSVDVWASGSNILSPWSSGYADSRNSSFYLNYLNGTSMATPNVTGVIALHLQSDPTATRVDVRNWLTDRATTDLVYYLDLWKGDDAVGINSVSYWDDDYGLRDASHRILYNPYANNTNVAINGVSVSGISFAQS